MYQNIDKHTNITLESAQSDRQKPTISKMTSNIYFNIIYLFILNDPFTSDQQPRKHPAICLNVWVRRVSAAPVGKPGFHHWGAVPLPLSLSPSPSWASSSRSSPADRAGAELRSGTEEWTRAKPQQISLTRALLLQRAPPVGPPGSSRTYSSCRSLRGNDHKRRVDSSVVRGLRSSKVKRKESAFPVEG